LDSLRSFSCLVGDVNFRINLPRQEIADRVEEGNYGALYDFDQVIFFTCLSFLPVPLFPLPPASVPYSLPPAPYPYSWPSQLTCSS
jgi:hypothetical protein